MLADGTIQTIEHEEEIYISLYELVDFFAKASSKIGREIRISKKQDPSIDMKYAKGLYDMAHEYAVELSELGKYEAQRRQMSSQFDSVEDLLDIFDNTPESVIE